MSAYYWNQTYFRKPYIIQYSISILKKSSVNVWIMAHKNPYKVKLSTAGNIYTKAWSSTTFVYLKKKPKQQF